MSTTTLKTKAPRRQSRETVIALAMWATTNKSTIQSSLDDGKTVTAFAEEKDVAPATLRGVFTAVGISHGRKKMKRGDALRDILTVLNRVCTELNLPAPELLKHL